MLAAWVLVGCGGDDGGSVKDAPGVDGLPRDAAIDALPDAPTAVRRVVCPVTPKATVTTTSSGQYAWVPTSLAVKANDIVRFMPENIHRVVPHASKPTDFGMNSGATGEVRCLQFTEVGTFNYQCGPHPSMEGVVTVTN
ncbi:MAG: hypothetical protein M4D80_33380 [Myxococcota bacterium]|nr:hypothetical protein [Myxococcota bacterium]